MSVEERPLTATEIYEQINGGPGTGSLQHSQDTLSQLRQLMEDSSAGVSALNSKISEGFQGRSGNAAANATRPLGKATDDDLDHLAKVDNSISEQITAFSTVKNAVQPVAAQPPQIRSQDTFDMLLGRGNGYDQKLGEWAAGVGTNIQAFSTYYDASTTNGQNVPSQFGQVVDPGEPVVRAGTNAAGAPESRTSSSGSAAGAAHSPGPPARFAGAQAVASPTTDGPGLPAANPAWNDGTTAATYTPNTSNLPADYQFGPTGSLDPRANPNVTDGPGPGYDVGGGYGSGGLDVNEPGGHGVTGGPSDGGSSGPGGRGAGQAVGRGGLGTGRGSGVGPEVEAPARGGRPGPAGSAGKPGQGGLAGMAAGGKKDEDKERKRPGYLRNPDPEGTFADPVSSTPPPVIGEC